MTANTWRYIDENNVSAAYGLASDEYLMQSHSPGANEFPVTLRLYNYRNHCALCGRFQDLSAEIDLEACRSSGVDIGRRLTGGGAILMGGDQLGICLSGHSSVFRWTHVLELYRLFSDPIIDALASFGITAGFRSKNDLETGGRKIAGLGIHVSAEGGIQFHASVLLDLDIPLMLRLLKIPAQKLADKRMLKTVESRITTIRRESSQDVNMVQLKGAIQDSYSAAFACRFTTVPLSPKEKDTIATLERERYTSEDWLYQNSPQQDMDGMSLKKTAAGLLRTYIAMKGENIKSVLITGDFMEMPAVFSRIESELKWSPLDKERIATIVRKAYESQTAPEIYPDEVTDAIWLAAQRALAANKYTYKGSCYYPKENVNA